MPNPTGKMTRGLMLTPEINSWLRREAEIRSISVSAFARMIFLNVMKTGSQAAEQAPKRSAQWGNNADVRD